MYPNDASLEKGLNLARELFDKVGRESFDGVGFTRAAYGDSEQKAHDTLIEAAVGLNLKVDVDAALNTWMTLEGDNLGNHPILIGSHLDAVPSGGNFDGLAGVVAGMATVAAFREAGITLKNDITVLGIRGEESAWFGAQHIGSRSLLGTFDEVVLDSAKRVDTGRSLREHMLEAGADLTKISLGKPLYNPANIHSFLELHIEQGPVLESLNLPVGIVTGIRGNRRCRKIVCKGEYGHSGAVARPERKDTVFAVSELITRLDELWRVIEEDEGGDMVLTFGRFSTDPTAHAVTTIPGYVEFCFDVRSHSSEILMRVENHLVELMDAIGNRRNVSFYYDPFTGDIPAGMDPGLRGALKRGCSELSIPSIAITSGAGHDAGDFSQAGVSTAMLFIRNDKGSHNPDEKMEFADFATGSRLLTWLVSQISNGSIEPC